MNKVIHMMRWCLPFTASFIRNQIVYHERYTPAVLYTQAKEGTFHHEIKDKAATCLPLQTGFEKTWYRFTRQLSPAAKRRAKTFIQAQQPSVLHVHYGVDCLVYADLIRELNIPTCVSFYGYDCTSFPSRFYGYGNTLLKNKVFFNPAVKAVLAMTEDMRADLLAIGCPDEKIIVHYYGTETEPFYQERETKEKDVVKFLIISGFHPKKAHKYLIDAFAAMSRSVDKKVELHIVGDGPLRAEIAEKIAQSDTDNIHLHGPVDYGSAEHKAYFAQADVFVHPSIVSPDGDKEGIPGAIIEAMAAGLPVISTYHAGIPHIIENGETGVLVEEKNIESLQTTMTQMVNDVSFRQRIARNGQQHARTNLDVRHKEKELEEIYDSIRKGAIQPSANLKINDPVS